MGSASRQRTSSWSFDPESAAMLIEATTIRSDLQVTDLILRSCYAFGSEHCCRSHSLQRQGFRSIRRLRIITA